MIKHSAKYIKRRHHTSGHDDDDASVDNDNENSTSSSGSKRKRGGAATQPKWFTALVLALVAVMAYVAYSKIVQPTALRFAV